MRVAARVEPAEPEEQEERPGPVAVLVPAVAPRPAEAVAREGAAEPAAVAAAARPAQAAAEEQVAAVAPQALEARAPEVPLTRAPVAPEERLAATQEAWPEETAALLVAAGAGAGAMEVPEARPLCGQAKAAPPPMV